MERPKIELDLKGPEGNIEYLMHISKQGEDNEIKITEIVENSHNL